MEKGITLSTNEIIICSFLLTDKFLYTFRDNKKARIGWFLYNYKNLYFDDILPFINFENSTSQCLSVLQTQPCINEKVPFEKRFSNSDISEKTRQIYKELYSFTEEKKSLSFEKLEIWWKNKRSL